MKNKLGYLGFLGLIGLAGLVTSNPGMYGFFGFFGFFSFFRIKTDERLYINIGKAATNSLFVIITGLSILIVLAAIDKSGSIHAVLTAILFIATILTFIISLHVFENRPQ